MRPTIFKNTNMYPKPEDPKYLLWDLDEQKRISSFKNLSSAVEAMRYWKGEENGIPRNE